MLTKMGNKLKWAYVGPTLVKFGSAELLGQILARINQISQVNKPQEQNKLLLNWVLGQKWDKLLGLIQVGSTEYQVKQKVNLNSLVGGGCMELVLWCGVHWVGHKTPPKWWCWDWADGAGQYPCPAVVFEGEWGPQQKS